MNSDYESSDNEEQEDESSVQFLPPSTLESEMKEMIADVQSVLEIKTGVCRILLHKYKWNKDSLFDKFYEHPDTTAFLIDAQVIPKHSPTPFPAVPNIPQECEICCELTEKLSGLACNHKACFDCWKSYLTEKIVEGRQCEIECMDSNCKLLIEDEKVMCYITDSTVMAMYERLTINSYVAANQYLKWCPGVDCGLAVKTTSTEPTLITCPCGANFCFACCQDWHEPINCHLLKKWQKRCSDDAETFNWILAHTKECPKCQVIIEKNGGCNHMTCRNRSCNYQFCWLCMGSWSGHASAGCNSFEDEKSALRQKSRVSLDRYLFYYHRHEGHRQSLLLEKNLQEKIAVKMEDLQKIGRITWVEVKFLEQAVQVLSTCRRTLMNTYAFAFYLKRDNHAVIFEANQRDLEMATETLSGFLEQEVEFHNDFHSLKLSILDKTRYVEHRRQVLLKHCAEGYEQNIWKFDETAAY
ncbi:hypothetical protein GCK72_007226 [Caenorhabditis remanei]|uniref:RBR-type E3 ubiquitin transferase n=1 Tax=Caenorhabditis remanei TaxID=31234 RepID=A0A6A5HL65_CAERE|nr:hypothetical protein GCK72_007226 [Caenorhabditis remanei]KAF1767267.1 hypothetical protein GCK72_007226 [Caenorhabditis remanei]